MSAESDAMVAAITAAEAAAVAMAAAYRDYEVAYQAAKRAINVGAPDRLARLGEFEAAIGPHIVAAALRGRLIALDARPVASQAGAMEPQSVGWVAYLSQKVESIAA